MLARRHRILRTAELARHGTTSLAAKERGSFLPTRTHSYFVLDTPGDNLSD